MSKINLFLSLILLIFIANNNVNTTKLNYPRVLLPIFDKISINFTLQVIEKGCFKWTSSRQDLILIAPLYEDLESECSYRATVTVLTRERRRNTAIVLAEDMATGESQRCDVILDVIDKLGVHTTTRQLYLEEAPETFELRAEDSQGNAFTTMEGIEFNWAITSLNPDTKSWSPALRFITFTESVYHEVPPTLEKFEAKGIKGYMVLLEGINTGTAKVTVNMPYPEYSHVLPIEVYINVLANIILEPSDAYILAGDIIQFRILQLKMGKLQEISLNNQYFLEIIDTKIASIAGNAATGRRLGHTMVVLRDRNVPDDASFSGDNGLAEAAVPSARITVTNPHKLGISLLPHNNWITVEGERHTIAFDLYTSDDHKITLGSEYSVKPEFDNSLFFIINRSKNASRLHGEAVKVGTTTVFGWYNKLTTQAELQIYKSLTLLPTKVVLPYDPNIIKTQKIQFEASGGDENYIWHTQNPRILQINQNGLASTTIRDTDRKINTQDYIDASGSLLTAQVSVKVSLAKNQKITRQADVYFLPPVRLEIIKYNFETELDDYVQLHVAVFAYVNNSFVPFTKCDNLIFDYEFTNQIFQLDYTHVSKELVKGACQVVNLRSTAVGLTHLRISYKFQDKLMKDEVTLSVFEPLTLLNPIEAEIVLPIGASRNIIYANGQQKIFTLEAELTKTTTYDLNVARVTEFEFDTSRGMYAFTVLCREVGETNLIFEVYNALAVKNFYAYVSTIATKVHCVKPRFLNLYATKQLRSSCPLEMKNSLLHLKEHEDKFEIEIEVQDAKNRKLMNITSLLIDWEFASGEQHYHKDSIPHYLSREEEIFEGIHLPSKDILFINPSSEIATNFRVKGVVSSYDEEVLEEYKIYAESPAFGIVNSKTQTLYTPQIENEIRFMAVNSTLFSRDHISIFMSKNRAERIPLRQGSGYYDYTVSEDGIIDVKLDTKERVLIIIPLRVGNVRIELIDRCLINEPALLSVSIVSIGAIRLHVADRVERFKTIEAIVQLYDSNDHLLNIDPANMPIYDLSEDIFNPGILSLHLGDQSDLREGEIRYIVTGNNLGESKIVFHSGAGSTMISSESANIQVFPPLKLYPRNSTLVVGSNVQIYHIGGPQPDVNIVYYVQDKKIITMDSAIVTAHKLGETKITGRCLMTLPNSGKEIVISEDTVEVHVVPLVNIQIKTPLSEIRSGAVMPAAVWGIPDLSPMVLGTLANMRITWSTNQPDVIDIYNIFSDAGIEYSDINLISVRIKALNPGKAKIHASVQLANGEKLSNTVEVIVFKILELESPRHITMDWILVAPRSTIQLKANLDDVLYKSDSESKSIVKVTPDGVLRAHDTLGRDLIIAKTAKQTLPIGIEVKNVQYILASLEYPTLKLKQTESQIPRGMNFILKVSMHDNLGNEFSHNIEDVNGIKYELSHKDMVDVQIGNNWTIALNLPRETDNMIAISLKDITGVKHAEDFIKLSVAESPYLYPTKTIFSVGDIICFDSPLTLASIWKSSDEQIVSIDKWTGIAKVLGNRFKLGEKIVVTNGDKASGSFIKYDVEVRDADVIQFSKSFDIFSGQNYRAHLVLRNHLQLDKFANLIAKNISTCKNGLENMPVKLFKCFFKTKQALGQQLLKYYQVAPVFEFESGRYACQVQLNTSFNDVLNLVKTNDVHFELEAQLLNGLTDSISLKFLPGIKVNPESLLSTNNLAQELTITGLDKVLQKVTVKPSDSNLLKVNLETKAHGLLKYKIQISQNLPVDEQLFLNVNSPTTLQDIQIPILSASTQVQKCSTEYIDNTTEFIFKILSKLGYIVVGIVLLALTILIYIYYNPYGVKETNKDAFSSSMSNRKSGRNTSSHTTAPTSPTSPLSPMSPMFSQQQSPYFDNRPSPGLNYTPRNDSQIYGDSSLISPQKRINRRFL